MQIAHEVPKFEDLEAMNPNMKAICWDMDGTICNTEATHAHALFKVLCAHCPKGAPYNTSELEHYGTGLTDYMVFKKLQAEGHLTDKNLDELLVAKNNAFIELIEKSDPHTFFDLKILNLLESCSKKSIRLALVTSSERPITELILKKLDIKRFFKTVITQEDTEKNKPNPDPYFLAMKRLDVKSEEVLICEDSKAGLEAATSTNATVINAKWYL